MKRSQERENQNSWLNLGTKFRYKIQTNWGQLKLKNNNNKIAMPKLGSFQECKYGYLFLQIN